MLRGALKRILPIVYYSDYQLYSQKKYDAALFIRLRRVNERKQLRELDPAWF